MGCLPLYSLPLGPAEKDPPVTGVVILKWGRDKNMSREVDLKDPCACINAT